MVSPIEAIAYRVSGKSRAHKWEQFLAVMKPEAHETIVDIGVNTTEYSEGDNYLERHYAHPENITAVGLETDFSEFNKKYPRVKTVSADGTTLPFPDNAFDISSSNAVIEHVGDWTAMIAFLREMHRVSKRGYLTTPNRFFPVEVHTRVPLLHFLLPKALFDRFLTLIGKSWATGNYMHLLSKRDLTKLLKEAGIEATILPNRLLGLPLTYTVFWKKSV